MTPAAAPEGRKVKSGPAGAAEAADRHERAKDYLSPAEMARLLDAAKAGRLTETKTHILCPRPASNWGSLKYSAGLARDALEVENQWRGQFDFGGRSRTSRTLVGTSHNNELCVFCRYASGALDHKI